MLKLRFPRLYVSSWLAFCGVLFLGIVLNCGGDYSGDVPRLCFGWPWPYGSIQSGIRERILISDVNPNSLAQADKWIWWRCNRTETLSWGVLAVDTAVVLLAAVAAAAAWEWRRRRRTRWLQFTLADVMAATAVVAIVVGMGSTAYQESVAEQRLRAFLDSNLAPGSSYYIGAGRLGLPYSGAETPCDWLWETLQIPYDRRPYRRTSFSLELRSDLRPVKLPAGAADLLARMRSQRELWLAGMQLSAHDFRKLAALPQLQMICLEHGKLDGEMLAALAKSPQLLQVELRLCDVNDEHLTELATCPTLKVLHLYAPASIDGPEFRGHRLSAFRSLSHLIVEGVALDDHAVEEIVRLPALELFVCEETQLSEFGRKRLARFLPANK